MQTSYSVTSITSWTNYNQLSKSCLKNKWCDWIYEWSYKLTSSSGLGVNTTSKFKTVQMAGATLP